MPIAPSGTRPISTWRRDSTSQSSEPTPMPTENTTSSSDATCVAAGELALVQVLRQIRELDRSEQRRVQAHQEDAGQQDDDVGAQESPCGERHHGDLEPLDEADQARLVELVGELAAGRRKEQER